VLREAKETASITNTCKIEDERAVPFRAVQDCRTQYILKKKMLERERERTKDGEGIRIKRGSGEDVREKN